MEEDMTTAENINTISRFCGLRDVSELTQDALLKQYSIKQADVMVLFGGSILCGVDVLASAIQSQVAGTYIIVGGYGHTTAALQEKMHEVIPSADFSSMQEAEIFDTCLKHRYGLHADYLETRSTNCGNNITNLLKLMEEHRIICNSIILSQDATMQRRMSAGMQKYRPDMRIINFAAYQAEVIQQGQRLSYASDIWGMWDMERYINLLMGEIPRLLDNENGYGPNGAGYIAHVDIDPTVIQAYCELAKLYRPREANPQFA